MQDGYMGCSKLFQERLRIITGGLRHLVLMLLGMNMNPKKKRQGGEMTEIMKNGELVEIKLESDLKREEKELAIQNFRESYHIIKEVLQEYCDLPQEYYPIISLWILGTY